MTSYAPLVGILPAAGRGTRLWPYRLPKELIPLPLKHPTNPAEAVPTPVCMFALRAMKAAGVDRCAVVISDDKQEVVRALGDGSDVGVRVGFLHQREPKGLPHAVSCAAPWLVDANVVLAMPDTVVLPEDALRTLHNARLAAGKDVMLGVFPSDEPERLGPVELDAAGNVVAIHDKPGHRRFLNAWALVAWSPRFTSFCVEWERTRAATPGAPEGVLGHAMEAARVSGMPVGAHYFVDGTFTDMGTPAGLGNTLRVLAKRGLLFEAHG